MIYDLTERTAGPLMSNAIFDISPADSVFEIQNSEFGEILIKQHVIAKVELLFSSAILPNIRIIQVIFNIFLFFFVP